MAKARSPRRAAPQSSSQLRKMTKAEAQRQGISPDAKRYVATSAKRVTKQTPTYSNRFYHNLQLSEQAGRNITKENFARAVKKGEFRRPIKIQQRIKDVSNARFVRSYIPELLHKTCASR